MKTVWKALAAVVRPGDGQPQVLVFRHPIAGVQLPKGTVEPDETMNEATLRELAEESGLHLDAVPEPVGTWKRVVGGGPNEDGPLEINMWSISILRPNGKLPDKWDHEAEGSPAEEGLTFAFFWLPLDQSFPTAVHPLFAPVARMILDHVNQGGRSA
jgi:8-oxo-dGTP pyrophosphatase MutT (NUDIX family)